MAVDLDDIDWAIIGELQQEARISLSELGRRVKLSPSATTERVRQLESLLRHKMPLPVTVTIFPSGSKLPKYFRAALCDKTIDSG